MRVWDISVGSALSHRRRDVEVDAVVDVVVVIVEDVGVAFQVAQTLNHKTRRCLLMIKKL